MTIQELHGWPQPRERTSHMIGRSLGETLQGASNLYLQNKIQGYFDQQKELRQLGAEAQQRRQTAQAYENLTGIKGLAQKLEGMPIQLQEKALSEYGGGTQMLPWNQPIRPPSGTNFPVNPPVNVPTAQKITGDIATAQRMGLTGEGGEGQEEGLEGTSGLPLGGRMPTPRGQVLQGQAPQYQEETQTPSGTIPPKPMSGYPLADMSNEDFLQYLNTIPSQSRRKEVYQAREKEKAAQRAEGMLSLKERDTIAREKKGLREEEKNKRELNQPVDNYIKDVVEKHKSQQQRDINLKTIESLSKKSGDSTKWKLGFGKMFGVDPELLQNRDENTISKLSNDLLPARMREFQGQGARIFATEVDTMVSTIPSLMQTAEGRITISRFMQKMNELGKLEYNTVNKLRKDYAKSGQLYPQIGEFEMEVYDRMEKEAADILQEAKEIAQYGQVYKYKPDSSVDKLPSASSVPIGQRFENDKGQIVESDGKRWIKSQK